ncbi:MAG: TIGR04283 family arsenosugar biosynthesis glycosyltransferase [Mariprofundaceae bacterium]|nr:TIGR04283 family arsenosugar biosynthesis glycosyltransferase [Mariprofundaceae bacterium]
MSDRTIAVVVPLLNEAKSLPQLFQLLDGLDADEIILVDGGSTDGSDQLLAESGFQWINSLSGRAVQMNKGAGECVSDILLFIHADTDICSSHISAVKEAMRSADNVGGRFDVHLSGNRPAFRLIEWMINLRSRLTKISTGDQCQFVRRIVFESLGGFPEQPLMEDIELSKRLKQLGKIACLRDRVTTSSRRWEQFGIFRTILLMWKLRLLYWLGVPPQRLATMYRDAR